MEHQDIEQLIFQLYNNPEAHAVANRYLTQAQVSKEAWTFSWTLLAPEKPVEVQYFGASSLHLKISKCWDELKDNESDRLALRHRLLEALVNFMLEGRSKIVQTRISVAIASYVVQTITNEWPSAISDLITNISTDSLGSRIPGPKIVITLLELLMMIPEEFHVHHMSQYQKNKTRMALSNCVPQVYLVIQSVMNESTSNPILVEIQQAAIKCFSNWSQHLGCLMMGDAHEEVLNVILAKANNEDLVGCISESIISIYTHPEIHKHPNAVLRLIRKLVSVEPILDKAIHEKDMDQCSSLFSLFVQIAETHSRLLLDLVFDKPEERDVIFRLMAVVLKCSATPGYYPVGETCSEQAFNFFYILQDDIVASDPEKGKLYMSLFKPLYRSLIETLLVKVRFPPDDVYNSEWSSEDKEAFRCYRQDIGDTFMYCYNMLRSEVLNTLKTHFDNSLNVVCNSLNDPTQVKSSWQPLEAVIFALSSVAENVEGAEDSCLGVIFNSLPSIPFSVSERLLSTAMEMIGSYTEWIYHHPQVLPHVLQLLLLGLKGEAMSTISSTMALKDLTRECQTLMTPYAPSVLMACSEGLSHDSRLKPKEKSRLACTVGQVLSILPDDMLENYLNSMLPPIFERLQFIMNYNVQERKDDYYPVRNEAVNQLSIVASLFSSIDLDVRKEIPVNDSVQVTSDVPPQSLFHVFQTMMPLIGGIGMKWINEEVVVEALSEVIKKCIMTLLDSVKPLVPDILHLIGQLYSASAQPSLIDVIKNLLLLFSVDQDLRQQVVVYFSQLCTHTINVCQDIREKTNLIEYFFTTTTSVLKKQTSIFTSNLVDNQGMFRLACASLVLPERPTVKASAAFIAEFINKSRDSDAMTAVVNNDGEMVVCQLFIVIAGVVESPRNVVEFMADILIALNQKYFDNLTRWLSTQIERENFPSPRVTREQKENFTRLILRERKNKRKVKEMVNEFALVTRGLVNEYGMQAIRLVPF